MAANHSLRRVLASVSAAVLVVGLMADSAPAVTDGARAASAPAGVWAGVGDNDGMNDWTIIAVMPGAAGEQVGFFGEYVAGGCGFGEVVIQGSADYLAGDFISITGDLVCMGDGSVLAPDADFRFLYDGVDDTLTPYYFDGNDWVVAPFYPGPFTRRCAGDNNTQEGGPGDDVIDGTSGHDVIDGKGGNDTIRGHGGMDILCGKKGRDRLEGGGSIDVLVGSSGKDKEFGGSGWDLLLGDSGRDTLKGEGGDDLLFGGGKPDTLRGGKGTDYGDGGGGTDVCTSVETTVRCP